MVSRQYLSLRAADKRSRFIELTRTYEDHLDRAISYPKENPHWLVEASLASYNRARNRYTNVLPWDRNRVRLPAVNGGSDYINALTVTLGSNKYIAAQGPLDSTIHHFWAMCFDQAESQHLDTVIIAMVTPLVEQRREKCAKYWPSMSEATWQLGPRLAAENLAPTDLSITLESEEMIGDCLLSRLRLRSNGGSKSVLHFHYSGWRDTLVPNSVEPLLQLIDQLNAYREQYPLIVPIIHCSAGVGRTGTFIAIDHFVNSNTLQKKERETGQVGSEICDDPIYDTVKSLRNDRMMMVQTVHQYVFLYEVAEGLVAGLSDSGKASLATEN